MTWDLREVDARFGDFTNLARLDLPN